MITWKHSQKDINLIMVYGFRESKFYVVTLTLHTFSSLYTRAYGFLAKTELNPLELKSLWHHLKKLITTPYLQMEVLPEHHNFYARFLYVESREPCLTFDGHECELFTVNVEKTNL